MSNDRDIIETPALPRGTVFASTMDAVIVAHLQARSVGAVEPRGDIATVVLQVSND